MNVAITSLESMYNQGRPYADAAALGPAPLGVLENAAETPYKLHC